MKTAAALVTTGNNARCQVRFHLANGKDGKSFARARANDYRKDNDKRNETFD